MEVILPANGPSFGGWSFLPVGFIITWLKLTELYSQQVTGWAGFIRVDGTAYNWLGAPGGADAVDQTDFSYTSTRSIFIMNVADKVEMNITFLTPVTPTDLRRQSLVFSYLEVAVSSLDGSEHDVQLYADVSAGRLREALTCD